MGKIRIGTGFDVEFGCLEAEVDESAALSASPIACAVADEWAALVAKMTVKPFMPRTLREALNALEAATRGSRLRKVKP